MIQLPTDQASREVIPAREDENATGTQVLREKLIDAMTPGYQVEFDPGEAERAGAFAESALSEADALASTDDLAA